MNPAEKGWLKKFITFRKKSLREVESSPILSLIPEAPDSFEYLYHLIQPTGLMYGYPIRFIEKPHSKTVEWREKDKIKVLLAEGYLSCGLYFHYDPDKDFNKIFVKVLNDIRDFYQENYTLYTEESSRWLFGRSKQTVDQIEYILDRRISIKYDWRNFWTSFFHNSFLFFDLIFFVKWMEGGKKKSPKQELKALRQQLRFDILKVIAAAAHADNEVQPEEKELFNYFLQSARLPVAKKRIAQGFINQGVALNELNLDGVYSWILKKYFLELAILTTWANREISPLEKIFLRKLAHQLDLTEKDLQYSMDAVQQFVLEYWQKVHYLQIKQNYRIISERLIQRMRMIVKKNQRNVSQEIQESRELVFLLRKSTSQDLTPIEKEKVREQLLDILRTIPAFALLFLPGSFLTLPILLRIIPKSILFPSSFIDKDED